VVRCALEDTMLDIVRHSVLFREFVTCTRTYHYTDISDR
jgi:hypothetical protein